MGRIAEFFRELSFTPLCWKRCSNLFQLEPFFLQLRELLFRTRSVWIHMSGEGFGTNSPFGVTISSRTDPSHSFIEVNKFRSAQNVFDFSSCSGVPSPEVKYLIPWRSWATRLQKLPQDSGNNLSNVNTGGNMIWKGKVVSGVLLAWVSNYLGKFGSLGEKRHQESKNGVSKSKCPAYLICYHFVTLRRQRFEQMSLSYFSCQWKESLDFFPPKAWGFVQIARFWLPVNIILQQFFNAAFELSNKELTELDSQFCLLF